MQYNGLHLEAYTDGSFNKTFGIYSGGVLFVVPGSPEPLEQKVYGMREEYLVHANAAGELLAVMSAVKMAIQLNAVSIKIYHDFAGVRAWTLAKGTTGAWKPKVKLTKAYAAYIHEARTVHGLYIEFEHIKAHSGNAMNERADMLAKEAIKECIKSLGIS